jgi:hypothetical protein
MQGDSLPSYCAAATAFGGKAPALLRSLPEPPGPIFLKLLELPPLLVRARAS